MRSAFPLFQSHLDLAHRYWQEILRPGDCAIDATCGNGHDALHLCQLLLEASLEAEKKSTLYLLDKQPAAIQATRERLLHHFSADTLKSVHFLQQCHSAFPSEIGTETVRLLVYNLGYLPSGDKTCTTTFSTTIQSLKAALPLIAPGGLISVTCYPGHPAGEMEERAVLEFAASLKPQEWSCCVHRWLNRWQAPSLLLIQKGHQGQ
jgi:hypothetical protein